jgi:SagB-type dehydrogenase family enzyme
MTKTRRTLPEPRTDGPVSVEAAIARRRSVRDYTPVELTLEEIGQLLWSGQGITGEQPDQRAAPSAGGRHPLVFYVCRHDGVWHYHPETHHLIRHLEKDVREDLAEAAWRQEFIGEAPCVFAISAIVARTTERYPERGRGRYIPMDVGHAAENMLLEAVALGLGSTPISAFDDEAITRALVLPAGEEPIYLITVGHPEHSV